MYTMSPSFVSILTAAKAVGDRRYFKLYKRSPFGTICTKYNPSNPYMNIPVVRYAEILLLRAESYAQPTAMTDYVSAQADVNRVRLRAGLPPNNSNTGAALIQFIQNERDMELAMEGDHYSEVKRRKGTFYDQIGTYQWNDPTMIYPIPQQEVNENKNIIQNPGY